MPILICSIAEILHGLLQNRCFTSITDPGPSHRVMIKTVSGTVVFVIASVSSKHPIAVRASKMPDVIFPVKCFDVIAAECLSTFEAQHIVPAKVICLAKSNWHVRASIFQKPELASYYFPAIL